jgi:hypothetical protein
MKRLPVAVLTVILSVLFAAGSFAQTGPAFKWRGSGGWGPKGPYQRLYDPKTVESIKGTVESIETQAPMKGMGHAVILTLKTDKGTVPVHLGPEWYIERLDVKIEKGDSIRVRGSNVMLNGKPTIIASEIQKGPQIITLRDTKGIPVWAGWK